MSELEATSPPPQQAQPDLGPRKDGAPGATNKALHDQRYYKDRVCDAPRKLATVAPPKKIGGAPRPKKRLDPKLGDLDSYRVVACDAPVRLDAAPEPPVRLSMCSRESWQVDRLLMGAALCCMGLRAGRLAVLLMLAHRTGDTAQGCRAATY